MKTSSINRNLVIGLLAIIAFFILQIAGVLTMGSYTEREVVEVARKNTVAQVNLAELSTLAQQIRRYEKEYFIYVNNPEKRAQYQKEWTDTIGKIDALIAKMRDNKDSALSSTDVGKVGKWEAASNFYALEMNKIFTEVNARAKQMQEEADAASAKAAELQASKTQRTAKAAETAPTPPATRMFLPHEANDLIKAGKDRFSADLIKDVAAAFTEKSKATLALTEITNEGFTKMIYGMLATIAIGIGISLFLLLRLPKSISTPIDALTKAVDSISKGESSAPLSAISVKEFNGLSSAIERMRIAQSMMMKRLNSR
jgi:HAMP domain-containing protein